jgi:hypothetical protein
MGPTHGKGAGGEDYTVDFFICCCPKDIEGALDVVFKGLIPIAARARNCRHVDNGFDARQ